MGIENGIYVRPFSLIGDANRNIAINAARFDELNNDIGSTLTFLAGETARLNSGEESAPMDDSKYPLRAACKISLNRFRSGGWHSTALDWAYNVSGVSIQIPTNSANFGNGPAVRGASFRIALDNLTLVKNRTYVLTKFSGAWQQNSLGNLWTPWSQRTDTAAVNVMPTAIDISFVSYFTNSGILNSPEYPTSFANTDNWIFDVMVFYLNEDIGMAPAGG